MVFYNLFNALKKKIEAIDLSPETSVKVHLYDPDNLEENARLSILVDFELPEGDDQISRVSKTMQELSVTVAIYYTLPKTRGKDDLTRLETVRNTIYREIGARDGGFLLSDVPGNEALAGTENDQGLTGNLYRTNLEFFKQGFGNRWAVLEKYEVLYRDDVATKQYIEIEPVTGVILDPRA